jgi:hypothetical protein
MQSQIKHIDIEAVQFSTASLHHIQQTVSEALLRYLDQHDPHDHELRYGKVSGLMDVLEQLGEQYLTDAQGEGHSLSSIRNRVDRFLDLLLRAPVSSPGSVSAYLSTLQRAGIKPSSLNLKRFAWDLWELRALAGGASSDLAEMGRGALRRQHFCENPIEELKPDVLLNMVVQFPFQAESMFMRLLVHSTISESARHEQRLTNEN